MTKKSSNGKSKSTVAKRKTKAKKNGAKKKKIKLPKSMWSTKSTTDLNKSINLIIPEYDLANNFVYFNDLANTSHIRNPIIAARKKSVYSAAVSGMNAIASPLTAKWRTGERYGVSNVWKDSYNFLEQAASLERAKEFKLILKFLHDQKLEGNQELRHYREHPEDVLNDPYGFYVTFTRYLNDAMKMRDKFQKELNEASRRIAERKKSYQDYVKTSLIHSAPSNIHSFLSSHIKGKAVSRTYRKTKDGPQIASFSGYMGALVDKVIDKIQLSSIIERMFTDKAIATPSLMAAIYLDLTRIFQEKLDELQARNEYKISDITELIDSQDLEQLAIEYAETITGEKNATGHDTYLQRTLRNGRAASVDRKLANELLNIARNMEDLFGVETLDSKSVLELRKQFSVMERSMPTQQKRAKSTTIPVIDIPGITIRAVGANSAAYFGSVINEALETLLNPLARKAGPTAATDIIRLIATTTLHGATLDDIPPSIYQALEQYINITSKKYIDQSQGERHQSLQAHIDFLTQTQRLYEEATEKLIDLVTAVDEGGIEDLFIVHESLKWYTSAETGNKWQGFHGRTLNIMSFLAEMADLARMSKSVDSTFLDSEQLLALVLNLADGAVGSPYKGLVENYFSIFMSIFMFDDYNDIVSHMGQDFEDYIHSIRAWDVEGTVYKIHLYQLNGIYMPASFLLDATARNVKYLMSSMSRQTKELLDKSQMGGSASIDTNGVTSAINSWLSQRDAGRPQEYDDWVRMADSAAGSIAVKFIFAKSFNKFIQDLQQQASKVIP